MLFGKVNLLSFKSLYAMCNCALHRVIWSDEKNMIKWLHTVNILLKDILTVAYTYFIKIYCDKGRYICFINKRYVIFPFQIYIYIIYEKTSPESGEIFEWDPWQFCIFFSILRTSQPMRTTTCIHFFFI